MSSVEKDSASPTFFPKRILVPVDGSENSKRALVVGIALARKYGSNLMILNAVPVPRFYVESPVGTGAVPSYYEVVEGEGKRVVQESEKLAKTEGVEGVSMKVARALTSVVQEIVDDAIRENVDLIVIGTRGLGGFKRLMQGSVSSGVVTHAHCNVLVVR